MRNLIFIILIFNMSAFAQDKLHLVTNISGSWAINFGDRFGNLGAHIGAQFQTEEGGDLRTSLVYQFSTSEHLIPQQAANINANFIGASLHYLFRKHENRVRPFFEIAMLLKAGPNFSKNLPSADGFLIINQSIGSDENGDFLYTRKYSTPFIGGIMAGCDFKLIENLHLNLGAGFGIRTTKTKSRVEYEGYDPYSEDNPSSSVVEKESFSTIDFRVGISYHFPLRKDND